MVPDWSVLQDCRTRLDQVDQEIIRLFGERYAIRRDVKQLKQRADLPVVDPERVRQVLDQVVAHAEQYNVPTDFAEALYRLVIDYSHRFEEQAR